MRLGERVRAERKARQMTLAQLAGASGLTKGFVSQMERGITNPSLASLRRIASAMSISVTDLLEQHVPSAAPQEIASLPQLYHLDDGRAGHTFIEPFFFGTAGHFSVARLARRACLLPTVELGSGHTQVLCMVMQGEVEFTQGTYKAIISAGDAFVWDASIEYAIENYATADALLLVCVADQQAMPQAIEQAPSRTYQLQHLLDRNLDNGPLKLAAMRAQRNERRSSRSR